MTTSDQNADTTEPAVDELALLKEKADKLGMTYHPSIGLEKLTKKIEAFQVAPKPKPKTKKEDVSVAAPIPMFKETTGQKAARLRKEAGRLHRIRVSCLNPNKKDWDGEIFSVGNSVVGQFKKYVPFNVEEGWHVPTIIVNYIKNRECQIFKKKKAKNGQTIKTGKIIKEFALEILDPLTPKEMQELAQRQAMAAGEG